MQSKDQFKELQDLCHFYRDAERGEGDDKHWESLIKAHLWLRIPGKVTAIYGYENADDGLNGVWIDMDSGLTLWVTLG